MYPPLEGIESKYAPTSVHLQVYDGRRCLSFSRRVALIKVKDAAHVLPVLFSFTTPAKYCHRAIATFCKYVTGRTTEVLSASPRTISFTLPVSLQRRTSRPRHSETVGTTLTRRLSHSFNGALRRSFSAGFIKTFRSASENHTTFVEEPSETARPSSPVRRQTFDESISALSGDVSVDEPRRAGDVAVYLDASVCFVSFRSYSRDSNRHVLTLLAGRFMETWHD
jgi:hypothetical protein